MGTVGEKSRRSEGARWLTEWREPDEEPVFESSNASFFILIIDKYDFDFIELTKF
jgi:hypothetical protein